jgi:integrase
VKGQVTFVEPKSDSSRRTVAIPEFAVDLLKRHRVAQKRERLAAGARWKDLGLVFTTPVGTALDYSNLRKAFRALLNAAGLEPMRIHDLRHTCATLLLAQGVHPKLVQETLGHSQISLTLDTYSHVIPAMREEVAKKMDALLASG